MGRKASVGKGNPKRQSTLSPAIRHRRIESSKITHLSSDDIAEHLYSAYPDYKHYKLIPFRSKVRQILQHSRRLPMNYAAEENNHDDVDDEEGEEGSELCSPLRKKQRQIIDDREMKLVRRENDHLQRRRRENSSISLSYSISVSTSEDSVYGEEVAPEFDLMKSMLRAGYGDAKSTPNSKSKQKEVGIGEERNVEVEDVRTEKKIGAAVDALGRGEKSLSTRTSQVLQEGELKGGLSGPRFKDFGGMKKILDELMMEVMVPLYHSQLP